MAFEKPGTDGPTSVSEPFPGVPTPPSDSERRQATVLFADISGFTRMSEQLDPEEVQSVINRCFTSLASAVDEHGGYVDKYIGDCVMALFGVPRALERAPQQALRAALAMRNRLAELNRNNASPVPLDIHIGVNTGLVVAGYVGSDVKQEFTVVGDAVNLASRLKDAAPNGSIWIGPETYRYVRDDFELRKVAPVKLKGKEQAVDVWELVAPAAPARSPARHVSSPLVGRETEITLLRACLAAVGRGEGGIVHIVGEPGLGKSRLIVEACAAPEASGLRVLEGRSLAVGLRVSFHPFVDLLRQWAQIRVDEGEAETRGKLEAAVGAACGDARGEVFPFVATLMGLRLDGSYAERLACIEGEALEKLILRSVRELLRCIAAERPLVVVLEDLHWADLSSIRLLEGLLGLTADAPILFLHAFRPRYRETSERIAERARTHLASRLTEISLVKLDAPACDAFVRGLLQSDHLPHELLTLVRRTCEGNPFYIEEVIRALIDEGVLERAKDRVRVSRRIESVVIPGTIQGVIMVRVDRLPPGTRQLLQIASVLGRSFYHQIVRQLVPAEVDLEGALAELKERQFLFEYRTHRTSSVRRSTLAQDVEYVFQHALVKETVYESILQKTRKELHLKVARAIEATFPQRIVDFYGTLAYHWNRAGDLVKAEEYLFKAGDEAARAAASSEALEFFREASRLYLLLNGDRGDPRKKALLERNIGLALRNTGRLTESIAHFDRALEHLGEHVPRGRLAVGLRFALDMAAVAYRVYLRAGRYGTPADLERERAVSQILYHRGQAEITSDPSRLFLQTVPNGLRRFNRIDPRLIEDACSIYVSCAGVFAYSGFSFALSRRMLEIAETLVRAGSFRDAFIHREARFTYHYLHGEWGDEHVIEATLVEQALRHGEVWDVTTYLGLDCDRRARRGDFAGARQDLELLKDINDNYGYGFAGTSYDGYLKILCLERRDLAGALEVAERYLAGLDSHAMQVYALATIAEAHLRSGDTVLAAAALARAEEIGARSTFLSPWHRSSYLRARLLYDVTAFEDAIQRGDRAAGNAGRRAAKRSARAALRGARKVAKERVMTYRLVGRLAWLAGRQETALQWWQRTVAVAEQMGARPELARTLAEVGERLEAAGRGKTILAGMDAAACRARAEALFTELGLAPAVESGGLSEALAHPG